MPDPQQITSEGRPVERSPRAHASRRPTFAAADGPTGIMVVRLEASFATDDPPRLAGGEPAAELGR